MENILRKKTAYLALIMMLMFSLQLKADSSRYASQSVLATGKWIKIKVEDNGFYKITYEKLREWGISEPKNVQVYGYGGWMLNQDFSNSYLKTQDDLPKVAVWMSNTRENFGSGDYILFYGKGSLKWEFNKEKDKFRQIQNPYSRESFYFITESTDGPLIMDEITPNLTGSNPIATFDDYYLNEKDLVNISESGREFYGENFRGKRSQDFAVTLPGISSADYNIVDLDFIARNSASDATVTLSVNGGQLMKSSFGDPPSKSYEKARGIISSGITNKLTENNTINITYNSSTTTDENIYLNYFRINYKRQLKPYGAVTLFRSKTISSLLEFKISDATNKLLVFDITNGETPQLIKGELSGTTYTFKAANNEVREYAMVDVSKSIPEPSLVGSVANQNLHGLQVKDMVIIVRPALRKYAENLAQAHFDDSGLESIVVTAEDIYNEFSSGKPDITAYRRFMKMFYDRAATDNEKPKYLLLFGNGTYDNRFTENVWTETDKKSLLLSYQSVYSVHEEKSFTSDDYLGFLDDNEGWDMNQDDYYKTTTDITSLRNYTLDIGIGRLPVCNESEAANMVAKIKSYMEDKDKAIWKNNITFVADDLVASVSSSLSSEFDHVKNADNYTNTVNQYYPEFLVNKIYLDAFERTETATGGRYYDAEDMFIEKINSGQLLIDYIGHGSTRTWTHEKMLDFSRIEKLTNKRLPAMITATCDFGRYDAKERSGGEMFVINPNGGAIAMFTTVRVVYSGSNDSLNKAFINNIFKKDEKNRPLTLGDIMRKAKVAIGVDANKLRFALLGDPALRLSYPGSDYTVKVKTINGINVANETPTIKALSNNTIKGEIVGTDNSIVSDFNGTLESIIYDSKQLLKTRGNQKNGVPVTDSQYIREYVDYTNLLYSGNVKIENGEFTIEFVAPKDILYSNDYGKMSFYASCENSLLQAQGSFLNYKVGGMDENAVEENNPPVISKIYLNKEDFVSGDKVNSTPVFYAEISDDTGINLSNSIGHNLALVIDGTTSYNLRSSFESTDGQKAGKIKYIMPELPEGNHTLLFRAWDLWNNPTTATLDFEVVHNYKPVIYDFQLIGNPAKNETTFKFYTDVNGSEVDVKYQVFSMTGSLVWTHEIKGTTNNEYVWDLTNGSGSKLQPGIYICRMLVSVAGGAKATKSEKLVILKQ